MAGRWKHRGKDDPPKWGKGTPGWKPKPPRDPDDERPPHIFGSEHNPPPLPAHGTGLPSIDRAFGGAWPKGSVLELDGDDISLAPILANVTIVDSALAADAVRTANVMLGSGSVVAITLGDAGPAEKARTDVILEEIGNLSDQAVAGGGVLLLVRKNAAPQPRKLSWLEEITAAETRILAAAEAKQPATPGPAVVARIVSGGPAGGKPMRFHVGFPGAPDFDDDGDDDHSGTYD